MQMRTLAVQILHCHHGSPLANCMSMKSRLLCVSILTAVITICDMIHSLGFLLKVRISMMPAIQVKELLRVWSRTSQMLAIVWPVKLGQFQSYPTKPPKTQHDMYFNGLQRMGRVIYRVRKAFTRTRGYNYSIPTMKLHQIQTSRLNQSLMWIMSRHCKPLLRQNSGSCDYRFAIEATRFCSFWSSTWLTVWTFPADDVSRMCSRLAQFPLIGFSTSFAFVVTVFSVQVVASFITS